MAKIYGELVRAQFQLLEAPPTPAVKGLVYYDTSLSNLRLHNGAKWISLEGDSYRSGIVAMQPFQGITFLHNLDLPLSRLKVEIYNSLGEDVYRSLVWTIQDQGDKKSIFIELETLTPVSVEIFIRPLNIVRGGELESSISINTTGTITALTLYSLNCYASFSEINSLLAGTLEVKSNKVVVNKNGTNSSAQNAGISVVGTGNTVLGGVLFDTALSSKFKVGSLGFEKEIATTSDIQVLTNKDYDGGTASNQRRMTLPKATYSALLSLTRKAGTLYYATDHDQQYLDNGATLNPVGGSWSGGSASLSAEGTISLISLVSGLQLIVVSGSAAAVTLATTFLGTSAPSNGTTVRLVGSSNDKTVTILSSDVAYGALLNGDCTLGRGSSIELQYVSALQRWVEISRNMIGGF